MLAHDNGLIVGHLPSNADTKILYPVLNISSQESAPKVVGEVTRALVSSQPQTSEEVKAE
jgi:hypothetical protein